MEEMAGLNFVKRNDDILEEDDVFFSQGNSKTRDDAGQDIKKFRSPIELESFMDETVEAVINGFSDHFSPGDQLSIKSMKNILKIFSFSRFF